MKAKEAQQGNPIKMLPNMAEVQGLVVSSVQGAAEFWIREQQIALALAADCTKKKDIRAGSSPGGSCPAIPVLRWLMQEDRYDREERLREAILAAFHTGLTAEIVVGANL